MKITNANVMNVTVKGYSLMTIRLWCYSLAFLNLFLTGSEAVIRLETYILEQLMTFPYIPFCIYCDWQERSKADINQLNKLRRVRDIFMTSILFPVTVFSDVAFWAIFLTYPEIIASPRLYDYASLWTQHSVHTLSLGFVFMDLLLTPRHRPSSHKSGLAILYGFMIFYSFVVYVNYIRGDMVYSFLETASGTTFVLVFSVTLSLMTVYYYVQWYIVDYVWNNDTKLNGEGEENRVKKYM